MSDSLQKKEREGLSWDFLRLTVWLVHEEVEVSSLQDLINLCFVTYLAMN
jgi:hypothetical protein